MKLSILDQSPVSKLYSPQEAIQNSIEIAQVGEDLGYERYWLAEHHNTKDYASAAPEVILAHIAAHTESIRLGTGGIMMMHYSPYKIAEVINTLASLAPNRFDFGAGRAPGTDERGTMALAFPNGVHYTDQYDQLEHILALSKGEKVESNPILSRVEVSPRLDQAITPYLLGSSGSSAQVAGRLGIGYSFAQFFMLGAMNEEIFELYRQHFQASDYLQEPYSIVAYLVTVGESREEAEYQARPVDLYKLRANMGQRPTMLVPEEAQAVNLSDREKEAIAINRAIHLVGTADDVLSQIKEDQEKYGFDEAMICTINPTQDQRLKTYKLLAVAKDKF